MLCNLHIERASSFNNIKENLILVWKNKFYFQDHKPPSSRDAKTYIRIYRRICIYKNIDDEKKKIRFHFSGNLKFVVVWKFNHNEGFCGQYNDDAVLEDVKIKKFCNLLLILCHVWIVYICIRNKTFSNNKMTIIYCS